ncbi:hypothetical protein F0L68_07745 [Solihabitans fulvus]|uniref:Uncharacterized protein n=1 Tax=Solihabitans fulvus TaxID=1892852 RepID=A0A5B2XMC9_9PSEU|nr:hypothetical protein [Solihabitans fulvus]KAA2264305.1 hypothetical protein F0L68_07745 [Solihabitans fulvus]
MSAQRLSTERPVPRWAVVTARAIPFVVLPQSLWRLPFAFGFTMGMVEPNAPAMPEWAPYYVFGLSLLSEGLALLSFGLVRGWGEVVPAWLPLIGGKRVPPFAAIVPAAVGGLALTVLWGGQLPARFHLLGLSRVGFANGWWDALATVCSSPLTLWGPMLLAVTFAYYQRRCRPATAALTA